MFSQLDLLPPDPILGLTKLFRDDTRPEKIDLGVGVYRDASGGTPVMNAVGRAQQLVIENETTKAYTPVDGAPGFGPAVLTLIFGDDSAILDEGRAAIVQTPGGCGALRLAGELLAEQGAANLALGSPTWPNHVPLLSSAGLQLKDIPYYDLRKNAVDFDAFKAGVATLRDRDVLLLHGRCHNPTGADLTAAQIDDLCDMAQTQGFLPLVDIAYHGFAEDLDADIELVRVMAERLPELLVTYSCSKNFGLYRERTGALVIVGADNTRADAAKSHAVNLARRNYSMPPAHGGAIVAQILGSPELSTIWRTELEEMTSAIHHKRALLARSARNAGLENQLDFIKEQSGMFSLLPLDNSQIETMRTEFGIYIVGGGRINLCGVNESNVDHLIHSYRDVKSR